MQKSKKSDKILLFGIAALLLVGGVGLSFFPATRFSATEKRNLAAFPAFSYETLTSGAYTAALDDYAAERFPFRTPCRALQGFSELTLGRREAHGVILCHDGSLCRRPTVNESAFAQNLSARSRLQARLGELPLTVAVAPRRIDVRSEVLPALYDTAREQKAWEMLPAGTVTFLDATKDSQWYRTDHHWTQEGAYFAYVRLARYLGYTPRPASEFTPVTLTKCFLGTSAAAAGFSLVTPDTVSVWRHAEDNCYRILRDSEPAVFPGFYDVEKAQGPDPYTAFLGGNCARLQIERASADTRPTLLVIKDSFANSLLPFLALHYRIVAIDPRYLDRPLTALTTDAAQVLVLCGMETLTQAPFLSALLKRI